MRFPACQLQGFIENLQSVKERMNEEGIETGRPGYLAPAAPWGFFDELDLQTPTADDVDDQN